MRGTLPAHPHPHPHTHPPTHPHTHPPSYPNPPSLPRPPCPHPQIICEPAKLVLTRVPGSCVNKHKAASVWVGKVSASPSTMLHCAAWAGESRAAGWGSCVDKHKAASCVGGLLGELPHSSATREGQSCRQRARGLCTEHAPAHLRLSCTGAGAGVRPPSQQAAGSQALSRHPDCAPPASPHSIHPPPPAFLPPLHPPQLHPTYLHPPLLHPPLLHPPPLHPPPLHPPPLHPPQLHPTYLPPPHRPRSPLHAGVQDFWHRWLQNREGPGRRQETRE